MHYIGIDLGGTNIAVGLVDENAKLLRKAVLPTKKERPFKEIVKDMAFLSLNLIKEEKIDTSEIKSIGIGIPGIPDKENGLITYSPNLYLKNVPLRELIKTYIDCPIFVDNDANCAALAEALVGAASRTRHSITITLGTGIGGGIVIDGQIYTGFNDIAAELGHIVIFSGGNQCSCGRKGCFETYASAVALINQTKEAIRIYPNTIMNNLKNVRISAKTAFDAFRQNDEVAKKVIQRYIEYLAEGVANIINIFQPEVLVIGGGLSNEGKYILKPLREMVAQRIYGKNFIKKATQIRIAKLGNDAGIVGAAMLKQ